MGHKTKSEALAETHVTPRIAKQNDMRGVTRLTPRKKKKFCECLAKTGSVAAACRLVGISRVTAYAHRKKDSGFAQQWASAREEACDRVEEALLGRATDGVEEPVWYKGQQVGSKRVFSDTAAIFYLKGRRPEVFAQGPQGVHGAVTVNDNRMQITGLTDDQLESVLARKLQLEAGEAGMGVGSRHSPAVIDAELRQHPLDDLDDPTKSNT